MQKPLSTHLKELKQGQGKLRPPSRVQGGMSYAGEGGNRRSYLCAKDTHFRDMMNSFNIFSL